MARRPTLAGRIEAVLAANWWLPDATALVRTLAPLAWVYGWLADRARAKAASAVALPVPVIVVGNFVVGGAGKTPTVVALVEALRRAGRRPGVISRGHGRRDGAAAEVAIDSEPSAVGDEPLLIRRRCGVPVWVGRDRPAAARALCDRYPEVDVIVSDDGLQHHRLARCIEIAVFDDRGIGNGRLLPAGPLRQALPLAPPPRMQVLYTGTVVSTPWPGCIGLRCIERAWPLADWLAGRAGQGQPLAALRGRPLLAVAGIAAPAQFFSMLEALGLDLRRLPLPDHFPYLECPWDDPDAEVVTTEKDAVKLGRLSQPSLGGARIWVLPLDLQLPQGLIDDVLARLPAAPLADQPSSLPSPPSGSPPP